MSVLSDFADRVEAFQATIDQGVDGIVSSIQAIDGDVKNLKQQITDLQNSPGAITQEDQDRLNRIEAAANSLATKTSAAATAAVVLDQQTEAAPEHPV